ncbi:hypothetical protein Bca4012_071666 [Brassica carinata]
MPARTYNHLETQTQSPGKVTKQIRPKPITQQTHPPTTSDSPYLEIRTRVVATTGRTYVRARTRLTGHYMSMHHRDKPEPMTSTPS